MVYDYLNCNINNSIKMQLNMLNLCKELFSDVNPIPIKKTTEILDMSNGIFREPLIELDEQKTKSLKKEIQIFLKNK